MNDEYLRLAVNKVREMQADATDRFLAYDNVRMVDGEPYVARTDCDAADGSVIVYFSLENKSYFLAVRMESLPQVQIQNVYIEAGSEAYLICFSTTHPLSDLLSATQLSPTEQWDMDAGGGSSGMYIKVPLPLADNVDDNISLLLNTLEQDAAGVRQLSALANTFIQVHWYACAKAMPMFRLNSATLERMANLKVAVDVDILIQ